MCLYTPKKKPLLTAKEDITVYKNVGLNNRSMFHKFEYEPNTFYRLRKPLKLIEFDNKTHFEISEGFHSFSTIKQALYWRKPRQRIVKFIIPKGTKYFTGSFCSIMHCYASAAIRSGDLTALD